MNSKRFLVRAEREINRDSFIQEWPETGLIVFNSPFDPKPQIRIAAGRITELDGMQESEFDIIDRFIASHAIDSGIAAEAMRCRGGAGSGACLAGFDYLCRDALCIRH